MARGWKASGIALAALVLSAPLHASELDWLAGHWCGEQGKTFSEETWMVPRGGLLVGMHRDTRDGKATGFEFMRIARQDGRWVLLAQPGGATVTAFPAERVDEGHVVFANPAHDFPKRVIYSRPDAGTLHARIDDGRDDGQAMEWTWRREAGYGRAASPSDDSHSSSEPSLTPSNSGVEK